MEKEIKSDFIDDRFISSLCHLQHDKSTHGLMVTKIEEPQWVPPPWQESNEVLQTWKPQTSNQYDMIPKVIINNTEYYINIFCIFFWIRTKLAVKNEDHRNLVMISDSSNLRNYSEPTYLHSSATPRTYKDALGLLGRDSREADIVENWGNQKWSALVQCSNELINPRNYGAITENYVKEWMTIDPIH